MTTTQNLDIRDFNTGDIYFVVTNINNGRCILNGMFIAAFTTKPEAKEFATSLGPDHAVVKQIKS